MTTARQPAPAPYDRTTHDGKVVDQLTHYALLEAEARLGYPLTITQGSYNAGGVSASAGTHDGGGVVDLAPADHDRKVTVLRAVGFFAWYRPELVRNGVRVWPAHIHAGLIGNRKLSPAARRQVSAYLAKRNGLADNGPDVDPGWVADARFTWRMGAQRIARARVLIARARAQLATGVRGYAIRGAQAALDRAEQRLPRP